MYHCLAHFVFCRNKDGQQLCNAANSEKAEGGVCRGGDGRVSMTLSDETCGITVDSTTGEDTGDYICKFLYVYDNPPMVSQTMRVEGKI